ncbi:MAG: Asp-tRNA(Asn)/Glu-tRNA(Gln) amidotransferase subunit GatB [Spirochaetes bacterium]|nr:Asp-tRNA(Asn)/Glu-tRNA(Gln) amidotransferase subunit GatB [Spirochaetota bacterium]
MNLEAVIGLEIHVQLNTKTKTFCSCSTGFGAVPNTHTCPVCLGLPGALPVFNRDVLKKGVMAGLALNCTICSYSVFARKNYFYPDLPKAYQISQFEHPLNRAGFVRIKDERGKERSIGITRAHLEEDAGKLVHDDDPKGPSFIDLNRCGMPLLEIVTEPDLRTPDEAYRFLVAVKEILQYTEVSECSMEKGELRVDVNVSLRETGEDAFGVKQEVKNLNSFANVKRALEYEIKRQSRLIRSGERLTQQTRLFDVSKNATVQMRTKESAHDYRYFPDPDLVPIELSPQEIDGIRETLPELPEERRDRIKAQYGLTDYDVEVLCSSHKIARYFEDSARGYKRPKKIANWIHTEVMRALNETGKDIESFAVTPERLRELFEIMDGGVISGKLAKAVFDEMAASGETAAEVVERKGMRQLSDREEIVDVVEAVIRDHAAVTDEYRSGKKKAFGFLVGQVMKRTGGKANPKIVNELLKEKLSNQPGVEDH